MWSNDMKYKFMFMFPLKNLARKELNSTIELTHPRDSTFCLLPDCDRLTRTCDKRLYPCFNHAQRYITNMYIFFMYTHIMFKSSQWQIHCHKITFSWLRSVPIQLWKHVKQWQHVIEKLALTIHHAFEVRQRDSIIDYKKEGFFDVRYINQTTWKTHTSLTTHFQSGGCWNMGNPSKIMSNSNLTKYRLIIIYFFVAQLLWKFALITSA